MMAGFGGLAPGMDSEDSLLEHSRRVGIGLEPRDERDISQSQGQGVEMPPPPSARQWLAGKLAGDAPFYSPRAALTSKLMGTTGVGNASIAPVDFIPGIGQALAVNEAVRGRDPQSLAMAMIPGAAKSEAKAAEEIGAPAAKKFASWADALTGREHGTAEAAAERAPAATAEAGLAEPAPAVAGGAGGGDARLGAAQAQAERAAGRHAPLQGLPSNPLQVGGDTFIPGPIGKVKDVAEQYMRDRLIPSYHRAPTEYHPLDPEHSANIAQAYEEMPHDPENPAVKASYEAMIKETRDQYRAIRTNHPDLQLVPNAPGQDPYAATPRLAAKDVIENNRLHFFPTDQGFGTTGQGGIDMATHPMMQPSGETLNGKPLLNNDLFRIVHDYFGHLKEGHGFRAAGEDNAWRSHASMYSDLARPAMTTETRGQNSWVNFGPHGEANKGATAGDTDLRASEGRADAGMDDARSQ